MSKLEHYRITVILILFMRKRPVPNVPESTECKDFDTAIFADDRPVPIRKHRATIIDKTFLLDPSIFTSRFNVLLRVSSRELTRFHGTVFRCRHVMYN